MRRICAERPQADLSGADVEDTIPGFAVPDLASHLPDGEIVVDTGWTDAGGRQIPRRLLRWLSGPTPVILDRRSDARWRHSRDAGVSNGFLKQKPIS